MGEAAQDMSFFYDLPVTLQVQLGESTLTLGDLLKCGKGSVIPLTQKVGQPFLILLHNKPLAEGEVVDVNGQLGIKITNVLKAAAAPGPETQEKGGVS